MTTRNRDASPSPAGATRPAPATAAAEPPARPGARHDSDPDGLSAPGLPSPRYRSDAEPLDVMLKKIANAPLRVPNSFEPGISKQAEHVPAPAAEPMEPHEKVAYDPPPDWTQPNAAPSHAPEGRPDRAQRHVATVVIATRAPMTALYGFGIAFIAGLTALALWGGWFDSWLKPSSIVDSAVHSGPPPARPPPDAPPDPSIEVPAHALPADVTSAVRPPATEPGLAAERRATPTLATKRDRTRAPAGNPPAPSLSPSAEPRPVESSPIPSPVDSYLHPFIP